MNNICIINNLAQVKISYLQSNTLNCNIEIYKYNFRVRKVMHININKIFLIIIFHKEISNLNSNNKFKKTSIFRLLIINNKF